MITAVANPREGRYCLPLSFSYLQGSKRVSFAASLDSIAMMQLCLDSTEFLNFFFRFEHLIVQEALKYHWGHVPCGVYWKKCVFLLEKEWDLRETTIKSAIEAYLNYMNEASDQQSKQNLENGVSWKLVFWFFPNIAHIVNRENMSRKPLLTRLLAFMPREAAPYAPLTAPPPFQMQDVDDLELLSLIYSIHGEGLRALVQFCTKRHDVVRDEELRYQLAECLGSESSRVVRINDAMCNWVEINFTSSKITVMLQIYQLLHQYLVDLWMLARSFVSESGGGTGYYSVQSQRLINEDTICTQSVERLLATTGIEKSKSRLG